MKGELSYEKNVLTLQVTARAADLYAQVRMGIERKPEKEAQRPVVKESPIFVYGKKE